MYTSDSKFTNKVLKIPVLDDFFFLVKQKVSTVRIGSGTLVNLSILHVDDIFIVKSCLR